MQNDQAYSCEITAFAGATLVKRYVRYSIHLLYTVTPTADAGGSICRIHPRQFQKDKRELYATAEEGRLIVLAAPVKTLLDSTYTTAEITSNCSVVATFAEIPLASYVVTPTDAGEYFADNFSTVSEGQM